MTNQTKTLLHLSLTLLAVVGLWVLTPWNEDPNEDAISADAAPVRVMEVIDGDTIRLESGQTVRYIGIDTPETKHPQLGVQCYGEAAFIANRDLVEGKTVSLQSDVSDTDRYGRLLRYVYLDDTFVNLWLVEQGYARSSTFPPDVKYQLQFREAEVLARQTGKGMWSNQCDYADEYSAEQQNFDCAVLKNCAEMSSCEEAFYYLDSCGATWVDGNSDGIPCTNVCAGR